MEVGVKSDLVDLELEIRHRTENAILVAEDHDSEGVWLPLSQVEVDGSTVTMPEWLALEKELI